MTETAEPDQEAPTADRVRGAFASMASTLNAAADAMAHAVDEMVSTVADDLATVAACVRPLADAIERAGAIRRAVEAAVPVVAAPLWRGSAWFDTMPASADDPPGDRDAIRLVGSLVAAPAAPPLPSAA